MGKLVSGHPRILRRMTWANLLVGGLFVASPTPGQLIPISGEFQVNTYTTGFQDYPVVAYVTPGEFVVFWSDVSGGQNVRGRRYDGAGSAIGGEFLVNSYTVGIQRNPAVGVDASGNFVVVWHASDGDDYGIFGTRLDSTGQRLGSEFQVNTYTQGRQFSQDVAVGPSGGFLAVWHSPHDGASPATGVFGQVFDSLGGRLGIEFQVNSYTVNYQRNPNAAADLSDNFIVVWESLLQDGSSSGAFGQRYDSLGGVLGSEFQISVYTPSVQERPDVAADGAGGFVVCFTALQGSDLGIAGRRFDSLGSGVGSNFQVNTYTVGTQSLCSVAAGAGDDFLIAWQSPQDGSGQGILAQYFDGLGSPAGMEFQVNTYTIDSQYRPNVATDLAGGFTVVWDRFHSGPGRDSIGRVFAAPTDTPTATPTSTPTPTGTPTASPTNTPTFPPTDTPTPGCPPTPDPGCLSGFDSGSLLVKENVPGKEKLIAKLVRGPALNQTALGNPLVPLGTSYSLCIFDGAGALVQEIEIDRAFQLCSGGADACWEAIGAQLPDPDGKGYKYKDADLAAQGIAKILLKGGAAGKSKAILKGLGPNLPDGIPAALQSSLTVTVQLHGSNAPQCLSITLTDIKKQRSDLFKAKK